MATPPQEDESMLVVLVVLFLVVVSTIYVFSQQQQQQQLAQHGAIGGRGAHRPGSAAAAFAQQPHSAANAITTSSLTEQQLRLHRSLPSRHGARAITICVDALVRNKTDAATIAWASDETPRVLADLLLVADVYILCKLTNKDDQQVRECIQRFLTTSEAIVAAVDEATATKSKRPLQSHKVLFCTTSIGKIAFVRQIEPQVHVEVDYSVVRELEKHVPRIVHVVPSLDAAPGPGLFHVTDSFATYFELLRAM